MQGTIIEQGLELMLYGMGTVVLFLALLVVATTAMSRLLTRYFPQEQELSSAEAALRRLHANKQAAADPALAAAIGAAVHRYRANKKQATRARVR